MGKRTKVPYKSWGNYAEQTVKLDRNDDEAFVIRQQRNKVTVLECEIDSLIVALLNVKEKAYGR